MTIPEHLFNKVWFTRKAWINAEERLLLNEHHTQLLMVVYAAYTTCVSVVMLKFPPALKADEDLANTAMAVLSIILLALSLYLNSKTFKDRAARFKQGYHELQEIENELVALKSDPATNVAGPACTELAARYAKALREVENHNTLDDIRARILAGSGLTSRHPRRGEVVRYYWWRIWRFCTLALLYVAPVGAALWFHLK
ncbi:SLATT domain-containing protein [Pseudoduganella flava]|uniref:SLATT domain-containing protein n=1 Tax=Pseudoduganella flava TaxID=871742 RepID=UPI0013031DDC|nr:SLATT domain-containing protein [Pseudoduganella flava]